MMLLTKLDDLSLKFSSNAIYRLCQLKDSIYDQTVPFSPELSCSRDLLATDIAWHSESCIRKSCIAHSYTDNPSMGWLGDFGWYSLFKRHASLGIT